METDMKIDSIFYRLASEIQSHRESGDEVMMHEAIQTYDSLVERYESDGYDMTKWK